MSNAVKWIENSNKWELHFEPFYEDEIIAIVYEEDDGGWCYDSKLLNSDNEYLGSDGLESAKADIESLIEEHYQGDINYYIELLEKFKEREKNGK